MSLKWRQVTVCHVIKAIERFDNLKNHYPESKNTFLVYNGKEYPAKYIRKLSYHEAFGYLPENDEFSGGENTAKFFRKLGFEILKTDEVDNINQKSETKVKEALTLSHS